MRSLALVALLSMLQSCGLMMAYQDGEFTREHLPLLANDLRDGASMAIIIEPELANSSYIALVNGVADRWDDYYATGQVITLEAILDEADLLSKDIAAAATAEGAEPAQAAQIQAIMGLLFRRLERLTPTGATKAEVVLPAATETK